MRRYRAKQLLRTPMQANVSLWPEASCRAALPARLSSDFSLPRDLERVINVNLLGTIYCCQNFAPLMMRNQQGAIVNFSTIAVALGLKGESIYAASKAGVEGFSRA